MDNNRRLSLIGGWLWILTFATSIPALFIFYAPGLDEIDYVLGAGQDARIATGALLEMILIIANIGTALAFLPVLRRQNYALAHGYVAARIMESVFIAIGIVSMLSLLLLRSQVADGTLEGSESAVTAGSTLVAIHDVSFQLGPGFVVGVGNGLLLGYLMYRSGLVPRGLAILGLIGGTLIVTAGILVMYDVIQPGETAQALMTIPEAIWELSLGLYLIIKGFRSVPILNDTYRADGASTGTSPAL